MLQALQASQASGSGVQEDPSNFETLPWNFEGGDAGEDAAKKHGEGEEEEHLTDDDDIDEWTADPEIYRSPCRPHKAVGPDGDDDVQNVSSEAGSEDEAVEEESSEDPLEVKPFEGSEAKPEVQPPPGESEAKPIEGKPKRSEVKIEEAGKEKPHQVSEAKPKEAKPKVKIEEAEEEKPRQVSEAKSKEAKPTEEKPPKVSKAKPKEAKPEEKIEEADQEEKPPKVPEAKPKEAKPKSKIEEAAMSTGSEKPTSMAPKSAEDVCFPAEERQSRLDSLADDEGKPSSVPDANKENMRGMRNDSNNYC